MQISILATSQQWPYQSCVLPLMLEFFTFVIAHWLAQKMIGVPGSNFQVGIGFLVNLTANDIHPDIPRNLCQSRKERGIIAIMMHNWCVQFSALWSEVFKIEIWFESVDDLQKTWRISLRTLLNLCQITRQLGIIIVAMPKVISESYMSVFSVPSLCDQRYRKARVWVTALSNVYDLHLDVQLNLC